MPELMERASKAAAEGGGSITIVHDMADAFREADAVYPKSWGRLDLFTDEQAALEASAPHRGWICDSERMALAKEDGLYLHCLPADRGSEVTDEVIDGPQSVVYEEAENRLHTGKALMALTMGGFAGGES
jgi:ornithine carbamoyltransferase